MLNKVMVIGVLLLGVLYYQDAAAENFSANIGYNSEYIYRGIPHKSSSAFAGLDWAAGDFDGSYFEAGYGNTLTLKETDLFDYAIAAIYSDSTLLGGEPDTNLVFTLSKTFSF